VSFYFWLFATKSDVSSRKLPLNGNAEFPFDHNGQQNVPSAGAALKIIVRHPFLSVS
jgi:hypothetical protein